ncbi:undecaprenyl-phosphate galactose phosphotransferase WbaP [Deinococcus radiopugnans]|uniref:Undecaprenyl-phosphate galactose phosphotransferase WbaP n=1 Tax=Deinococcus radiopugnans ATCC 19172 TaxID=585398 RepID=A0A5C4YBT6_9DEIO|nr:undecaprenyl-phosphate galactose phosphotransferase WbaP [Deinococcus radiopugnans]MBB6015685.1 Undecaprenyl-phosphate galactose phosphotransferase WbaP [Deinococcus radiopugnans ATCC 19172]QLG11628.1 undecaprenyl-phosphate galactose phosphotransferase WbaP [Deinococcus sp. D7000]TNM72623.1 undecaprenyl-phosphate galactose phosphotransferase WbaP [Deinococcus radiopugnans ATCC 19172]
MGVRMSSGAAPLRTAGRAASTRLAGLPQAAALLLGDVLSALLALALASWLLVLLGRPPLRPEEPLIWMGLWIAWRAHQGLYPGYGRSPQTELRLHTVGTVQVALAQLAAAFATHRLAPSVTGLILLWASLLVLALIFRYGVRALLVHWGQYGRDISVIGAGRTAALTIAHLRAHPTYGLRPVATYDDNPVLHGTGVHGVPVVGPIALALTDPLTEQALITIPGARAEIQRQLVNSIYAAFPITWVVPDLFGVPNQALQPHNIGTVASLEIRNNLRSGRARLTKGMIDVLAACILTALLLPCLLVIVVAIKLDSPGPAVYRARRLGHGGRPFNCYKFRSMHSDAETKLRDVLANCTDLKAEFDATHKLKDDPRVTRVGAFLRRTSLDELPQLFNVLRGEMSLVGPRPIVQAEIVKYGAVYGIYKQVRPGMTGYWQVNGRSDTTYDERVGMDQFYVTNWSPWLDLLLMIQTVRVVVVGKGAY